MTGRQSNRQRIKDAYNMINLLPKDYVEFLRRTGMDAGYLYSGWFLARKTKADDHGRVHHIDGIGGGR